MIRNVATELTDFEGNPFTDAHTGSPLTLKRVIRDAVAMPMPDDQRLTNPQRLELNELSERAMAGTLVDFTDRELVRLEERIGAAWPIPVFAAAHKVFNPPAAPVAPAAPVVTCAPVIPQDAAAAI